MTLLQKLALTASVAIAALAVAPRQADACSAPACEPARFSLPPQGGSVPANLPAILWDPLDRYSSDAPPDPGLVELRRIDGLEKAVIPLSAMKLGSGAYLLAPEIPLVTGATYRIVDHHTCYPGDEDVDFRAQAIFEVGPEAPLPTVLGKVATTTPTYGSVSVPTRGDDFCSTEVEATTARVLLEPDKSTLPWLRALELEVVVNGRPWHARWNSQFDIFHVCSYDPTAQDGRLLSSGPHEVMLRGRLASPDVEGGLLMFETQPIEVTLDCPNADDEICTDAECNDDAGCAVGGGGGALAAAFVLLLAALQRSRRRR